MFDPSSVVVGLEIGTSKICAVVADVTAQGTFRVLGLGQSEAKGIRKAQLAKTTRLSKVQVDGLLDLKHESSLDLLETAVDRLGLKLRITLQTAA